MIDVRECLPSDEKAPLSSYDRWLMGRLEPHTFWPMVPATGKA